MRGFLHPSYFPLCVFIFAKGRERPSCIVPTFFPATWERGKSHNCRTSEGRAAGREFLLVFFQGERTGERAVVPERQPACFYGVHLSSFSFSSIYHVKRLFDRPRTVRHHLNPTPVAAGRRPTRRRGSVACEMIFRAFNLHTQPTRVSLQGPPDPWVVRVCARFKRFPFF